MNVVSFIESYKTKNHTVTYVSAKHWEGRMFYKAAAVVADDPRVLEIFEKAGIPRLDPNTEQFIPYGDYHGETQGQEEGKEGQEAKGEEVNGTQTEQEGEGESVGAASEDAGAGSEGEGQADEGAGSEVAVDGAPEIPSDWMELSWPQKRSLATKLTDDPVTNKEEAERVISEHISA